MKNEHMGKGRLSEPVLTYWYFEIHLSSSLHTYLFILVPNCKLIHITDQFLASHISVVC